MHIIIVGGGFGGLTAAKELADAPVRITLIDRTNHHLFQPLLYQVATAALAPGDIAVPIRSVLSRQKNVQVLMGEVAGVDRAGQTIALADGRSFSYDALILAPGARHSYFGNEDWEDHAPGLKTLSDALTLREKLLMAYETAENLESGDPAPWLTFVVVGGGPTGVEVAGAIAEISRKTMMGDFRRITPEMTRVCLVEALDRILSPYPGDLSEKAKRSLENLGVEVMTGVKVEQVTSAGVDTSEGFIASKTVIWAAGNQASPLMKALDTELDRAGRAVVTTSLHLPGDENVFVIGDAASFKDGDRYLPGIAPVAMQQGSHVARAIRSRSAGEPVPGIFKYRDRGNMATIGRGRAIAEIGGFKLSGTLAWLMWSFIHVFFLIGFRNRIRVMLEWIWYYITFRGGFRLITRVNRTRH
jgi:NADH:ubiquinone reductase (H+-translocating)